MRTPDTHVMDHGQYLRDKTTLVNTLAAGTTQLTLTQVLQLRRMVIDVDKYEREIHRKRMHAMKKNLVKQAVIDLVLSLTVALAGLLLVYLASASNINLYLF